MSTVVLELPLPPSVNEWKVTLKTGRVILSEAFRIWKEAAVELARKRCSQLLTGALFVKVRTFRPRNAGDVDAPLKVLLDSLQGVVYANDSQVCGTLVKRYTDREHPRVLVEVTEVADPVRPAVPCTLSPAEREVFNKAVVALELARAKKRDRRKAKAKLGGIPVSCLKACVQCSANLGMCPACTWAEERGVPHLHERRVPPRGKDETVAQYAKRAAKPATYRS